MEGNENRESFLTKLFSNHTGTDFLIWFFVALILVIFIILLIPVKKDKEPINTLPKGEKETIVLAGANPYYLLKGNHYDEPGYEAYDSNGNRASYNVVVKGTVDSEKPGQYEITYSIGQTTVKRTVIVSNIEPRFIDDSNEYTADNYTIMLLIIGNDYLKTTLPNGTETTLSGIEYEVSENGTYEFVVHDKYNNQLKVEKKVETIDKEGPTGTCENKLDLGKTYVEVKATDTLSGMGKYIYNNTIQINTSEEPKYTYAGLYKDVSVTLVDNVGNKTEIKCVSSGEGATAQIKPPSGAKIIKSADSDTLKVSIEEKGKYYITRIWVVDPYSQVNKGLIKENWNKKRAYASEILKHEISIKNLSNKIVLGINGSGFYENGTWTPNCSSSYLSKYNRTTEGPLVIYDGTVIRNWSADGAVDKSRNHSIYTVGKEGYLEVYQEFNKLTESARKDLFNTIINKGYRNTWTFRPVAILKGQILTTNLVGEQMKRRNVVCQIDRNNWAILTGETTAKDAVNILKGMGCQTAVNMDGSGSVSLHFKSKNGSLEKIFGGGRDVVDTLYFTEQ